MSGLDARFWLDAAQWLSTVLLGLWLWQDRRHRATNARVDALREEFRGRVETLEAAHTNELRRVGEEIARLQERVPDGTTFRSMAEDIARLGALVEGQQASLRRMENTLQQLVENELRSKR